MDLFTADWTAAENKAFEEALAEVDLNSSSWFEHLATRFPNKTPEQLREHYTDLVVDIESIESGYFPNPIYTDPWAVKMATDMEELSVIDLPYSPDFSGTGSPCSGIGLPEKVEEENLMLPVDKGTNEGMLSKETMMKMALPEVRTEIENVKKIPAELAGVVVAKRMTEELGTSASSKGKQWTQEEHRLFLAGLNIHGRGAWRSIAKNFVRTRTPTQVASHAQKYFNRQLENRPRQRPSILDITAISETTKLHRVSIYDSVNTSSQTYHKNASESSPSSTPLPEMA